MAERKRTKDSGFVGINLSKELLDRLDAEVAKSVLNRSQVIRLALIHYLEREK